MTISNNGTRLEINDLHRTDTGAYSCRVQNMHDTAMGQDLASLLVQVLSFTTCFIETARY